MRTYTLGEMISALEYGQVAVKVNPTSADGVVIHEEGDKIYRNVSAGKAFLYSEEHGGLLLEMKSKVPVNVVKTNKEDVGQFVILDREVYEIMKRY